MARVMRHAKRYQQNFTLVEYGDWDAAEKAAAKWIRAKIRELPPRLTSEGRMSVKNRSGVVGVCLTEHVVRKPTGKVYTYLRWTARWPRCRNRGGVTWYENQWGYEDAFVLAVLSLRLKSVDRAEILARFDEIDGDDEYRAILRELKQ